MFVTTDNHALFQVTLKVLLTRDDKILTLRTQNGYIDFPGGRISQGEESLTFKDSIHREITEELGPDIKYTIGDLALAVNRHYDFLGVEHHIVALFYTAKMLSGEPQLSDEHTHFTWLTRQELLSQPKDKFVSIDEYNQLQNYLKD